MEGKESGESCFVYGKASSDSLDKVCSDVGNSGKEVGDDGGSSEGYLSSW